MEIWEELFKFALDFVFVIIAWWVCDKIKQQGYKQGYQDGLHDRKDELKRKIED